MSHHLKHSARRHSWFNFSSLFQVLFKENTQTHYHVEAKRFVSLLPCSTSECFKRHCSAASTASRKTGQQYVEGTKDVQSSCFKRTEEGVSSSPQDHSESAMLGSTGSMLITELDGAAVVKVCLAISRSEVPPDIHLRRLLASQLNNCLGDLRTETVLACLKILISTEDTSECRWAAEQVIRNCKGVVWGRAINLNAVLHHFKEMAPKVSNVDFVNLLECCVEVGISTTDALDVFLAEMSRRYQLRTLSNNNDESTRSLQKNRGNNNSPEIVGLILRSCEICQQARVLGRTNVGLSNK